MKVKFEKKMFLLRLLISPLLAAIIFTKCIYDGFVVLIRMIYGGFELVQYYHDRKTIKDIYEKVSKLVDNQLTPTNHESN